MKRLVVFIAVVVIGLLTTPVARASSGCSRASLKGAYAVSRQGTLVTSVLGLPAPAPWGEVALANFDGAGTLSANVSVNIGGIVIAGGVTGTYTVNADCTGTITVQPTGYPITITQAIVVIGGGTQYIATDTESFAVVQGRGERLQGD